MFFNIFVNFLEIIEKIIYDTDINEASSAVEIQTKYKAPVNFFKQIMLRKFVGIGVAPRFLRGAVLGCAPYSQSSLKIMRCDFYHR